MCLRVADPSDPWLTWMVDFLNFIKHGYFFYHYVAFSYLEGEARHQGMGYKEVRDGGSERGRTGPQTVSSLSREDAVAYQYLIKEVTHEL